MATNVTLPDAQALRAVARYEREHHKGAAPQTAPRPERKPIVRPPRFEPGTSPEQKIVMLLKAGFVQIGATPGGNPLFRHPQNPEHFAPFELYTKKRNPERAPVERPRRSAQEMVNLLSQRKPTPVRVTEDGKVAPADKKRTHKNRKVHGRAHLTPEQIAARKAAQVAANRAPKDKKAAEDDKSSKNGKGKNKNGTQKK